MTTIYYDFDNDDGIPYGTTIEVPDSLIDWRVSPPKVSNRAADYIERYFASRGIDTLWAAETTLYHMTWWEVD